MSNIKIIRTWWGNELDKWADVPSLPLYDNEIVYVWGKDNLDKLEERGYDCILMEETGLFNNYWEIYGKKLIVLDKALKHWGEVLLLDWDCLILKPLDKEFYNLLKQKVTQVPLYGHYKEPMFALLDAIPDDHPILQTDETYFNLIDNLSTLEREIQHYHWKWDDALVIPNFGCVYSRDENFGADLIKIAKENNIKGLVEEFAMWKYANCSLEEYINEYQPDYVLGVSDERLKQDDTKDINKIQTEFNKYIKNKINYKPYLEHV